jgi:hypothetical protein
MAIDPRAVVIEDTASAKRFAEAVRLLVVTTSDHIANQMVQIHPRLVARLQAEGLDTPGRFGIGAGSAKQAAGAIVRIGQKAAQSLETTGTLMKAFALTWEEQYATPVQIAEQMRKQAGSQMLGR